MIGSILKKLSQAFSGKQGKGMILPPPEQEEKPKKIYRIRIMPLNANATEVVKETKKSVAILFHAEKMGKEERATKLKRLKVFLANHGFKLLAFSPRWYIALSDLIEFSRPGKK